MRNLFLAAMLLPHVAGAADWVELGTISEARVLLDKESVEAMGDEVMARLKYVYSKTQAPQTISRGSPFDSSVNQYYLVCSSRKYQVLELTVFYKNKSVGSFHQNPNPNELEPAKLDSGVMLLIEGVCPGSKRSQAPLAD